jgi:hypothetical protein
MKYTSFNILNPYKEKEFEGYVNLDLYIASGRTGKICTIIEKLISECH